MRRLSPRVNVIPVVGRADSLTPQELKDFKRRVSEFKKKAFIDKLVWKLTIYFFTDNGRCRALQYPYL